MQQHSDRDDREDRDVDGENRCTMPQVPSASNAATASVQRLSRRGCLSKPAP